VQSLDVAGVYTDRGSGGNPFDYHRFHALRRLSVTIPRCTTFCIYDFMQFSGVRELNIRVPGILSVERLDVFMDFLEHDLSEEVHHVSIHIRSWDLSPLLDPRRQARRNARRDDFAQYILMLSNHGTLRSFAVYIAGEPLTLQWACQQLGIPPPGGP